MEDDDPASLLHEARVGMHTIRRSPLRTSVPDDHLLEQWSQTLDERDWDVCVALCFKILREHRGHLWVEQQPERQCSVYVTVPLMHEEAERERSLH
ncbi:MAG: hypothetical protein J2P36_02710 [Ktedonobacteraceae bacterium]|nr:hypothetical protein [Ktedonobacteraceae bacterium]